MNSRVLIFFALALAAGLAIYALRPRPMPVVEPESHARPAAVDPAPAPAAPSPGGARTTSEAPAGETTPPLPVPAVPTSAALPAPAAPASDLPTTATGAEVDPEVITRDLDQVSLSLRDYRTIMSQNPVGNNAEITQALMGGNPRQAQLAPPGARVNGKGEMIDRWGTAYFFHQLSATAMEIHSAGPDKKMGTEDDIILR